MSVCLHEELSWSWSGELGKGVGVWGAGVLYLVCCGCWLAMTCWGSCMR